MTRHSPRLSVVLPLLLLAACAATPPEIPPTPYGIEGKSLVRLRSDLLDGLVTSERLVELYHERIALLDDAGPRFNAILALNPRALDDARARDAELARGEIRGLLHGIPILLKDNIESKDPLPTTAGSLALAQNFTERDAPIVARLRAAGAIILGKANLSEWANIRSSKSTSGWSAVGGLTRNAHDPLRTACGSSAGSAVAVAASLCAAALGTETDGSITCPASMNGVVGLKPTVGLLSRTHIVPISHTQDTAGPMTRTVLDAALLLSVLSGSDPADPATLLADDFAEDYHERLTPYPSLSGPYTPGVNPLSGARLGVMRFHAKRHDEATLAVFEEALGTLRAAGAELVEIEEFPGLRGIGGHEFRILLTELKAGMNAYLATTPPAVTTRTLADVIAFNEEHAAEEMLHFAQEFFERAESGPDLDDQEYRDSLEAAARLAGPEGIDRLLAEYNVTALIAPTAGPAWFIDLENGDSHGPSCTTLPAVAGYPHLTLPMGQVEGLPVGLSFIGAAWSEAHLLKLGQGFEMLRGDFW
jgi:amidase